jgi:hypothetical protein
MARGGSAESEAADHRCGARHVMDPSAPSLRVGFRCCSGPAPELSYPAHARTELHELVEADDATLAGYLRQMPEVARFAEGFVGTTATAAASVLERAEKTEADLAGWRPFTGVHALEPPPRASTCGCSLGPAPPWAPRSSWWRTPCPTAR